MVRTFGHEILRCSVIVILSRIRFWQPIMIGASYHAQSAHLMAGSFIGTNFSWYCIDEKKAVSVSTVCTDSLLLRCS